jgi:hypothetical protein
MLLAASSKKLARLLHGTLCAALWLVLRPKGTPLWVQSTFA